MSVGADEQLDDDRQPLLSFDERGQVVREALGQHREDLRGRVDRRGVRPRVVVDGRALPHHGVDVGDGDTQRGDAVRSRADRELVEVSRVVVVDGHPRQCAQVFQGRVARSVGYAFELGEHCGRERRQQPTPGHRALGDVPQLTPRRVAWVRAVHEPRRARSEPLPATRKPNGSITLMELDRRNDPLSDCVATTRTASPAPRSW